MYFNSFPIIDYNNVKLRNIVLETEISKQVFAKYQSYYPYVIQEGERPDTIAYDYYDNSAFDWLIVLFNQYHDPYYQWPLTDRQMIDALKVKYDLTDPFTLKSQIKHYQYTGTSSDTYNEKRRKTWTMSETTYNLISSEERAGWTPVYVWDWEHDQNEQRKSIVLLDKIYASQAINELRTLLR